MAQTLEHNSSVGEYTAIQLENCDVDVENIQNLDDEPNDVGGLTAAELKAEFDKTGADLKDWINTDLIPAILAADATEEEREAAEAERVSNEQERVSNEQERVSNENARVTAEAARNVFEAYDNTKAYAVNNKVTYEGSSYVCTQATTAGTLPTNADYWLQIAAKGVSPDVTISAISAGSGTNGGYSITITDADHPSGQTFNILNGKGIKSIEKTGSLGVTDTYVITFTDDTAFAYNVKNGTNGTNGADGTDGVSPEVTITSITGGHRVTITDADHPSGQTFDVMDGNVVSVNNVQPVNGNVTLDASNVGAAPSSHTTDASAHSSLFAAKQNVLTFDTAPTEDSTNPVTSGGVFAAIAALSGVARVAVGSYDGTGTYGRNNHSTLTFPFAPKLVLLGKPSGTYPQGYTMYWPHMGEVTSSYSGSGYGLRNVSLTDCTLEWYSTDSASAQYNESGVTYYWIILG